MEATAGAAGTSKQPEEENRPDSGTTAGNSSPDGPAAELTGAATAAGPARRPAAVEPEASQPTAPIGPSAGAANNDPAAIAISNAAAPTTAPPPVVPLPSTILPEPLISTCAACRAPGATSAMPKCPACHTALYCSQTCLQSHAEEHAAEMCAHYRSELRIAAALEDNVTPLCRVLPAGTTTTTTVADHRHPNPTGKAGASTTAAAATAAANPTPAGGRRPQQLHPSLIAPVNARCHLCRGDSTTVDANCYRLVPTGCRHCVANPSKVGYVHPTCLARFVRRQSREDVETFVAKRKASAAGEAAAGDAEDAENASNADDTAKDNAGANDDAGDGNASDNNSHEEAEVVDEDDDDDDNTHNADAQTDARAEAEAQAASRIEYAFINAYTHCRHCHQPYRSFLGNALTQLAVWDSDSVPNPSGVHPGARTERGDGICIWTVARTEHAKNLMRAGMTILRRQVQRRQRMAMVRAQMQAQAQTQRAQAQAQRAQAQAQLMAQLMAQLPAQRQARIQARMQAEARARAQNENGEGDDNDNNNEEPNDVNGETAGTPPAGVAVPPQIVQAEHILREVLAVLGDEADGTDLDEYRMTALHQLGQIHRLHRRYEAAVDCAERCMDVVATTSGRGSFVAVYRDLAARELTLLHRELAQQNGTVIEVHADRDQGEDQSQMSDLTDRFRTDHCNRGGRASNRGGNAADDEEEESLDDNQAVAVVTVADDLYRQNAENGDDDDEDDDDEDSTDEDSTDEDSVDVPMDEIIIANDDANASNNDEHIREYEEARGREPEGSEAYLHLTLTIAELLAVDGRYADALSQLDVARDLSLRAFGADHALPRAIATHRFRLQMAQHSDWVPDLPSLAMLVNKVQTTQKEFGVDSIESFRMQIYLIAKHVQLSQVELGIQMVCALCNRAATVFGDNHEFTRGNNGVLASIRDLLATADHPWLKIATGTFTGVTIAGSSRSAMVVKDVVKYEWSETETDTLMTFVVPIWGGTEDGLTITFEEEKIVCGGSENGTLNLLGRIDVKSSSWRIDRGVQTNCIPGSSSLMFDLVKATLGQMWKLPCRMNIPDSIFSELMGDDEEEESNNDEEEEEELAAVN